MEDYKYEIVEANASHVKAIANLTYQTEGFATFVSELGLSYLKKIYIKNMVEGAFGYVVLVNNDFAGFLLSTDDIKTFYQYLTSKRRIQSLPYILFFALSKPLKFIELLKYKLFLKNYEDLDLNAELTLFAIKEKYRSPSFLKASGINIAKILLEKTIKEFEDRKVPKIKLEVPAVNVFAQVFYKSFGFEKVSQVEFNKVVRNIYVKKILE